MNPSLAVKAIRPLRRIAPILAVLLLAAFTRLVALELQPLRGDEAFAWYNYANRPLAESLREIAPIEPLPPGNYALFRVWRLWVGDGGRWLIRLLPALSTLVSTAAAYAMGLRLGTRRLATLAALLMATLPYLIWHAQDARNYAPWLGFSTVALALGVRLVTREKSAVRSWTLYALFAFLALAMAYQEAAVLIALTVVAFAARRHQRMMLTRLLLIQALWLGLLALAFLGLQGDLLWGGGYGGNLRHTSLAAVLELPVMLFFGDILPAAWSAWLGPALWLALGGAGYWLWRRADSRQLVVVAGAIFLVPLLLMALAGLPWRVFDARYALVSVVGPVLLAAAALDQLLMKNRFLALVGSLPIALLIIYGLLNYYGDYRKAVDWGALVQWLSPALSPADVVIQQSHDPAFSWYFARAPVAVPELALPLSPGQTSAALEQELDRISAVHDAVWTVGREYRDWPNAGITERWLAENRQRWLAGELAGIPYAAYLPSVPSAAELAAAQTLASRQPFGQPPVVELRGFRWDETPSALVLRLYWLPLRQGESSYQVFVHLVRAGDPRPVAQADQTPRIPTHRWNTGELLREIYTLETADLPPGDYTIRVGWYDPASGVRLPRGAGDSLLLPAISLP